MKKINLERCPDAQGVNKGKIYLRAFLGELWQLPPEIVNYRLSKIRNFTTQWPIEMIPFLLEKSFFYRPLIEIAYTVYQKLPEEDKSSIILPKIPFNIQENQICVSQEEFEMKQNGKIINYARYLPLEAKDNEYLEMYRKMCL